MSDLADKLYDLPPQDNLPAPEVLDRTLLECYSLCPAWGLFVERNPELCGSPEAMSGTLTHEVFAWVLTEYALHRWPNDDEPPWATLEAYARQTRPDLQQDVLAALRPSLYSWSRWVLKRSPEDFVRFAQTRKRSQEATDDEETLRARGGQLAREILPATTKRGPILATSELDTLVATPSEVVYDEIDYKTGHTPWTLDKVAKSFQFRLHAFLVFGTYKKLERLRVSIWMTRMNKRTAPVTFTRQQADDILGLLQQTVEYRRQALALKDTEQAETWPAPDKCRICPCLQECPQAERKIRDIAADPVAFAQQTMICHLQVEDDIQNLAAYVDEHGPNIEWPGGKCGRFPSDAKPRKKPFRFKETTK